MLADLGQIDRGHDPIAVRGRADEAEVDLTHDERGAIVPDHLLDRVADDPEELVLGVVEPGDDARVVDEAERVRLTPVDRDLLPVHRHEPSSYARRSDSFSTSWTAAFMSSRLGSAACSSGGLYGTGTGTAQTRRTGAFNARNVSGSSAISAAISEAAEHVAGASSTITTRPVFRTEARSVSTSSGTSVRGSTTSAEMPSSASSSASRSASVT